MKKKKDYKLIKVSYNITQHDLETKKRKIDEFITKGLKVKIQLRVWGRQRYLYTDSLDKLKEMFKDYKVINAWQKGQDSFLFVK